MARIDEHILERPVAEFMRTDFTALRQDLTVEEALASLRTLQLGEKIIYFYVVDADGVLKGVLPTRRLLMSAPEVRISTIMVGKVIHIPDQHRVADACDMFVKHRLLAFPVVDERTRILGVVDVTMFTDEIVEITEAQTERDVFQLIGVQFAAVRNASPWAGFRNRFPWLLCNIGGGLACAFLAARYEGFLDTAIVLALFIPVVLALAESVSIQSMSLTLQALHQQVIDWRAVFRSLRREFFTAALLGAACGAVVGGVAWGWRGELDVGLAIAASIALAIITACVLGVLLPTLVHVFRADPKIAAGPIVLATADIATLLFYFNVSGMILSAP